MESKYSCKICGVNVSDKAALKQHVQGKRHQKNQEIQNNKKKFEETGLYVSGFPPNVSPEFLSQYFERFGVLQHVSHHGHFAIIQFQDRKPAQHCLSAKLQLHGRPLLIRKWHPKKKDTKDDNIEKNEKKLNDLGCIDHQHVMSVISVGNFDEQLSAFLKAIQLSDPEVYWKLCFQLQITLNEAYPNCKAYPFGSTVTGLAFEGSDLDIFADLGLNGSPKTEEETRAVFNTARKLLYQKSDLYGRVITIPRAKTPIIKFIHKPTTISCDLNFKNALGIRNTSLIKFYLSLDSRLKPLLMIIKYWTKKNDLSGRGKISHYALMMLALYFMQQLEEPIIPAVIKLQESSAEYVIDDWNCGFNMDTTPYLANGNKATTLELLRDFFKFCSTFNYNCYVICPLMGKPVSKSLFLDIEKLPPEQNGYKNYMKSEKEVYCLRVDCAMCIQDPLELRHNVTAGVGIKTLETFKHYCKCAAETCTKALVDDDPKNSKVLTKVLGEKIQPEAPKNKSTIVINMWKHFLQPQAGGDDSQSDNSLCSMWYSSVFEVLKEIFQQVLKLEIENTVASENNHKVQKLEGQTDVGENMKSEPVLETTVLTCIGHHPVWMNRTERMKKLEIPNHLSLIKREAAISNLLIDDDKDTNFNIKFLCIFQPDQNSGCINLHLTNRAVRRDFTPLFGFLKQCLPTWIEESLKEKQEDKQPDHFKDVDHTTAH